MVAPDPSQRAVLFDKLELFKLVPAPTQQKRVAETPQTMSAVMHTCTSTPF